MYHGAITFPSPTTALQHIQVRLRRATLHAARRFSPAYVVGNIEREQRTGRVPDQLKRGQTAGRLRSALGRLFSVGRAKRDEMDTDTKKGDGNYGIGQE